jgi:hypothetical protein
VDDELMLIGSLGFQIRMLEDKIKERAAKCSGNTHQSSSTDDAVSGEIYNSAKIVYVILKVWRRIHLYNIMDNILKYNLQHPV